MKRLLVFTVLLAWSLPLLLISFLRPAYSTDHYPGGATATPTPIAQQQLNDGATFQLVMADAASPCTSIADTGGGSHNATVHGGVTCGATGGGVDGKTALTFNGSTGWLGAAAPTYSYPFTIEFAMNYSTINTGGLWDMNPGVGGTRELNCGVGSVSGGASSSALGVAGTCYASYATGQWIFVDVIYNTSLQAAYLNGALSTQGTGASGTYAQGATIGIGALNSGGANPFAGSLQDYAIYPSALSAATIRKHAAAYFGS